MKYFFFTSYSQVHNGGNHSHHTGDRLQHQSSHQPFDGMIDVRPVGESQRKDRLE